MRSATKIIMSDQARNYVKALVNSRLRPAEKNLLFFLADYHNTRHWSAWPSLQTLAEDTGLSLRYIRRLVHRCVELGFISYEPGLGRGNRGCFRFLELDTPIIELKEDQNEGRNEGQKGDQKEGQRDGVIRNEPEPELEPRTEDHHANGALKVWLTVKEQLKAELHKDEWNLWVRPTMLLRVMDHRFLLLAMPPNGAIMRAARERKEMLASLLSPYGYSFGFTKYPDDYERAQLEKLQWTLRPKRKSPAEIIV
jgi:hypothetical protein